MTMTNDTLISLLLFCISLISLLLGAHYASMIYRLHKAENELLDIRKEFAIAAIAAANAVAQAATAAAQATVAAGIALRESK